MAVTVEIKDRAQQKVGKAPAPLEEAIASAQLPGEKKMGLIALGLTAAALVLACVPWWFAEATQPFAIGMPLWVLLSLLVCLFIWPGQIIKKCCQKGSNALISSQNQPQIKTVLSKAAPILAVAEPDAVIDDSAADARMRVYPKALIFNEPVFRVINTNETGVLAARGLAHLCLKHDRRLAVIDVINRADPPILRLLLWPAWIYTKLLENLWLGQAHQSADRLAALLIRNPSLMLSAILKVHAANDANMQNLNVSSEDISSWIAQKGHIGMAGEEISTQYKLGRAIHEDPPFEMRLQGLQKWCESAEFKAALEKLTSGRRA